MKPKVSMALRTLISVGLIMLLLWSVRGHFARIAGTLASTDIFMFSLAALIFISAVGLMSLRLNLLFAGEGLRIPFGRVMQLSYIGFFFNNFMPTAVGGDIVKAYYVHKQTKETAKSFIAVFMDRFIGLFSFMCMALAALLFSWKNVDFAPKKAILAFTLAGLAGFLIILNDGIAKAILGSLSKFKLWNLGEKISRVYRAVHEYKNKKGTLLCVLGVSVVTQAVYFIIVFILFRALGVDIALKTVFLIMPLVSVVTMLPSLGGLGLREGAMVALFGPLIGTDKAFSASILVLATLLILSFIGGVIYLFAAQFRIKNEEISKIETYSV